MMRRGDISDGIKFTHISQNSARFFASFAFPHPSPSLNLMWHEGYILGETFNYGVVHIDRTYVYGTNCTRKEVSHGLLGFVGGGALLDLRTCIDCELFFVAGVGFKIIGRCRSLRRKSRVCRCEASAVVVGLLLRLGYVCGIIGCNRRVRCTDWNWFPVDIRLRIEVNGLNVMPDITSSPQAFSFGVVGKVKAQPSVQ